MMFGAVSAGRRTGGVFAVALRSLTGIFSAGAGFDNSSAQSLKSWLPPPRVAVVNPDNGLMTPEWYRFFRYIAEDRLGGASAPSIADVQTTVATVRDAVSTNVISVSAITDAVNANAQSLNTAIAVSQQNSLTGATQIPPAVQAPRYSSKFESEL